MGNNAKYCHAPELSNGYSRRSLQKESGLIHRRKWLECRLLNHILNLNAWLMRSQKPKSNRKGCPNLVSFCHTNWPCRRTIQVESEVAHVILFKSTKRLWYLLKIIILWCFVEAHEASCCPSFNPIYSLAQDSSSGSLNFILETFCGGNVFAWVGVLFPERCYTSREGEAW